MKELEDMRNDELLMVIIAGIQILRDNEHNQGFEEGLKEQRKQTEEIKVGYEVYNIDRDNKRIVTAIDGNKAIQLCSDGKYTVDNIDTLHWTGRKDLMIKKVLEQMKGETDGYTSINRSDNIQRP